MSIFSSLIKTRDSFRQLLGQRSIGQEQLDELEEVLLRADCGLRVTDKIVEFVRLYRGDGWQKELEKYLLELVTLERTSFDFSTKSIRNKPLTLLMMGVNGAGKTTTVAKLASAFNSQGFSVLFVSADTFRAAAHEQLEQWSKRVGAEVFKGQANEPAAMAYQAMEYAKLKKYDVLIVDTAGRQFNQKGLMYELKKIYSTTQKFGVEYPHECLLVVEAGSGQNAIHQAQEFTKFIPITGCIVTKLEGTAKGGMVLSMIYDLQIPVLFIGTGEKDNDLSSFNVKDFVKGLLAQ